MGNSNCNQMKPLRRDRTNNVHKHYEVDSSGEKSSIVFGSKKIMINEIINVKFNNDNLVDQNDVQTAASI